MKEKLFYIVSKIDEELIDDKLPTNVINHINKYHPSNDNVNSLVAYSLLKKLLENYSNTTIENINFLENGKPIINEGYISISHSSEFVAASYSKSKVGIDIELIKEANKKVFNKIFLEERENKTNDDFYLRWTLLEAKAKMNNTDIFQLNDVESCKHISKIIIDGEDRYALTITFENDGIEIVECK